MNSARMGVPRRDLILVTCAFFVVLGALELGTRWATEHIARGEDAAFVQKRRILQQGPGFDFLVLGDSAAQDGLMPELLAGTARSYNAAVPSGSGIVARELGVGVDWRAKHLVYAGVVVEVLDSWDLQRHERRLVGPGDLWAWETITGELLLSKLSRFFGMREELRAAAGRIVRRKQSRTRSDSDDATGSDGFRGRPVRSLTVEERTSLAKDKAELWFSRQGVSSRVRATALTEALLSWSSAETKRTLIIMPISSPLRALVDARPERRALIEAWETVARETDSRLLDCMAAAPDEDFYDDAHLNLEGAKRFSLTVGAWLESAVVPTGCRIR